MSATDVLVFDWYHGVNDLLIFGIALNLGRYLFIRWVGRLTPFDGQGGWSSGGGQVGGRAGDAQQGGASRSQAG